MSNDDRERVARVLHDAMAEGRLTVTELEERLDKVYAAKTFGDLEPLLRDLPVGNQAAHLTLPPPAPGTQPVAMPGNRIGGRGTSTGAVAIMSGTDRKGIWTVPPTFTSFALMGGIEIDLTQARFEEAETTIQAFAFMGGIEIYVPDDIVVQVNGVGFMGAFENHSQSQAQPRPGLPLVRITGLAVWGGVDVKRRKRKGAKEIED
ncbi:cell wall-active antibiotic response 4TMS protein YvqF [Actinophytocola oryzae]|uniref:Cell wall-active antibiotic response 4TMS protein YvqF n=1 Tax=Actinophytocola oryzae TaxID=502181 RepID=A0A4R7UXB4_9PSEU|nr:cell wall-active antibiotic response 4TMS protein YvqF [Actinophytocola oryzae]